MSQYPYNPPSQMPYGGYSYYQNPLAACSRAGILGIIFGSLMLLGGLCIGTVFWVMPIDQMIAQQGVTLPAEISLDVIRTIYTVIASIIGILGILYIVLSIFVRKGSRGSAITLVVFSILGVLWMLLNMVLAIPQMSAMGGQAVLGLCIVGVPFLLMIWLIIWLFQAIGEAGRYRAWQNQYLAGAYQQGMYPQQYPQQQQQYPSQQPQQWGQQQPPQQQQQQWPPNQNWPPPQNPT